MSGIRLHQKYGLAPTMPVCFWCGKDRGEIVLLGAAWRGDSEPPMRMVVDYEPCDACKEKMDQGVTLAEGVRHADGKVELTGRWAVVTDESIDLMVNDAALAASIKERRRAILDPQAFAIAIKPVEKE